MNNRNVVALFTRHTLKFKLAMFKLFQDYVLNTFVFCLLKYKKQDAPESQL